MTDEQLREADRRVVRAARGLKILSSLSWPAGMVQAFVEDWKQGVRRLPEPPPVRVDTSEQVAVLEQVLDDLGDQTPEERYLARTAHSWLDAAALLEVAGTPAFTEVSVRIYGHPNDRLHAGAPSTLEASRHLLAATEMACPVDTRAPLDAAAAAVRLQAGIDAVFGPASLPVEVDDDLTARSTAGSRRVRLRGGATYPALELDQLLQHEALVHSATARNGRAQPLLSSMGLGAPRTTCTQEGLATFAELITDTMDLSRLRRLALRAVAIDAAIGGADFVEVFELFVAAGQDPVEAGRSAMRIFRGGDVRGTAVFTKDGVYISGLLLTHAFFLKAIADARRALPAVLFCGRMTWDDAVELEPSFEGGRLAPPAVQPSWASNQACLSAFLTWSGLHRQIDIGQVDLGAIDPSP